MITALWGTLGGAAVAVTAALWAGLLAITEEAPSTRRASDGPAGADRSPEALARGLQVGRVTLLLAAGLGAAVATAWWARPTPGAVLAAVIAVVFLYLLAEGLPRAAGALAPAFADAVGRVGRRSVILFRPLLAVLRPLERGLGLLVPPAEPRERTRVSGERDLLAGVLSLRVATVAEVMTPRLDVEALEAQANWREVVELLGRSEHARIPVYDEDLDDIVGILYAKDLTPAVAGVDAPPERWHQLVRPAQFVPESKTLVAQLRDFQRGPAHLAIVVDEFGGTSGLVTMEDVLEEVVGEIHGEYDADEAPPVEQEGEDRFWVDGSVSVDTLSGLLHSQMGDEEVSTVGGLIYSELGRVPHPGEELRIGEFRVVVEQVVRRRVRRVYFERLSDPSAVEAGLERPK